MSLVLKNIGQNKALINMQQYLSWALVCCASTKWRFNWSNWWPNRYIEI